MNNWDHEKELTVYQFVIEVSGKYYDHYIQAPDLDEAKSIMFDRILDEDMDLSLVTYYSVDIPTNDVLSKFMRRTKD